jgi:hypothetical protein
LGFPIKKSDESASVGSGAGFGKPLPSVARRRFIVGQNLFIIALGGLGLNVWQMLSDGLHNRF